MENRLIKTFFDLIQITSFSGHEEKITDYLLEYFKKLNVSVQKDNYGNVIVKIPGYGNPLLLSAHCDTVEPGENIQPIVIDGIIKSKGKTILGADNKAGLSAILEAVYDCQNNNINHRSLELVFTRSEEVANLGAIHLDYSLIRSREGYTFDNANPIGTIITASPFYNRFDVTIIGKDAHASRPEEAINVLPIFTDAYRKIKTGKISESTLVNIGFVQAGHVRNTIPGELLTKGDIRSYDEKELEKITEAIRKTFLQSAKQLGATIHFEKVRENPGYEYLQKDSFIRRTQKIMQTMDIKPYCKKTWGISDANIFQEHGIKVLDLGDGSKNPHSIDESISVANLLKLRSLILSLITAK